MSHRFRSCTSHVLALMSVTIVSGFASAALAQAEVKEPPAPGGAMPIEPAKSAADMPKAEALFDKAVEAMGGREAFEKLKSFHVVAKLNIPQSTEPIVFDLTRGSDEKLLLKQVIPAAMTGMPSDMVISSGSDGETFWTQNPMMGGYQILEGAQRDTAIDQAMIVRHDMLTQMKDKSTKIETVGEAPFADEDCWKVKTTNEENQDSMLYFSKKTGRWLGMTASQQGMMGADMTLRLTEWKEFAPFTLYTKMEMDQAGQIMSVDFETVEIDKADPAIFELPAEVKTMVEKKKESAKPAEGAEPVGGAVPHDHDGDGKPDH